MNKFDSIIELIMILIIVMPLGAILGGIFLGLLFAGFGIESIFVGAIVGAILSAIPFISLTLESLKWAK